MVVSLEAGAALNHEKGGHQRQVVDPEHPGANKNAGFAVVLVLQGAVPALTTTNYRESRWSGAESVVPWPHEEGSNTETVLSALDYLNISESEYNELKEDTISDLVKTQVA